MELKSTCDDCGLEYEKFGLDLTLPDLQWKELTKDGATLLCANCICKRADKLPASIAIRAVIDIMWW